MMMMIMMMMPGECDHQRGSHPRHRDSPLLPRLQEGPLALPLQVKLWQEILQRGREHASQHEVFNNRTQ